jgi:membrane protease YdiL (CAAX protease family)
MSFYEESQMNTNPTFIQQYSHPVFLILTPLVGVSIALFFPLPAVVVFIVALVPALMAILLLALTEGRKGVSALLRKLILWRIGLKWVAVALLLPLGIQLAMSLLAFLLGWIPSFQMRPWSPTQLILALLILIWAVLEELGWRGFALPGLLAHRSALFSALLLGVSWGAFHLGLGVMESRPLIPTFLVPFTSSIVFAWLLVQTRGSLVIAILFHFGLNFFTFFNTGMTVAQVLWAQVIVTLSVDFILILLYGANLQRATVSRLALADAGTVESK